MLMTKYIFLVHEGSLGYHTVVSRLSDGAQKYFFQCGGSVEGITNHFESLTDELVDGFFPRVDKKGKSIGGGDPFVYLSEDPDRFIAEEQARIDLTHALVSRKV